MVSGKGCVKAVEIWDLYNENREIIGEHIRGTMLPENGFSLCVHIWVKNKEGKYLMTQRSANKARFPLKWECVGGGVLKGESSIQGAVREVKEEVGITFSETEGQLLLTKIRKTVNGHRYNDIVDVWFFQYDGEIPLENATTDEVAQAKWMTREEIATLHQENKLIYAIKDLDYFFEEMETAEEKLSNQ